MDIRPITSEHQQAVISIFNYHIENGYAAYPETVVPNEFFAKLQAACQGYPWVGAFDECGKLLGFGMLRPFHFFSVFKGTAEVSYFFAPTATRKGYGSKLLSWLEIEAAGMGIQVLLAETSDHNKESQAFHLAKGFVQCGHTPNIGIRRKESFGIIYYRKQL